VNEKPNKPNYFTGAGIKPLPGHEKPAEPIIRNLAEMGVDPDSSPWILQELVFEGDATDEQRKMVRHSLQVHIGVSKLHVPIAEDRDIKPSKDFPITFCFGPNPNEEDCLLLGTTTQAFVDAWQKYKFCYYEVHCWTVPKGGKAPSGMFFSTIVKPSSSLRVLIELDKPVIIPIDTTRGYRCMYAMLTDEKAQ
jgi:hypothetical protein